MPMMSPFCKFQQFHSCNICAIIYSSLFRNYPTVVIQSILQRYCSKVSYFIGTIYKHHDCERVQMHEADAVIILCDKKCANPESEDAGNITR